MLKIFIGCQSIFDYLIICIDFVVIQRGKLKIYIGCQMIFWIIIIKKIFSNEVDYSEPLPEQKAIRETELITEEKLITNYTEDKFIE